MEEKVTLKKEFPYPDAQQWQSAAEKLLKGRPFEKTLFTRCDEGITLKPIYNAADAPDSNLPGTAPYTRGIKAGNNWLVAQGSYSPAAAFNKTVKEALQRGQQAIRIDLIIPAQVDQAYQGTLHIETPDDLDTLLEGLQPDLPVFANALNNAPQLLELFNRFAEKNKIDKSAVALNMGADPISLALWNGGLTEDAKTTAAGLASVISKHAASIPQLRLFSLRGDFIHEAGGNSVQEMAYLLALGTEYFSLLGEEGLTPRQAAAQMRLQLALGNDTFRDIAKLRAMRLLWANMTAAWGLDADEQKALIDARCALRNKSYYDPWVNMLRVTAESFAAICGGCDSLEVLPFDRTLGLPDDFSRRIARNTQIILREESHLDKVTDPAGGAAYIETITLELAEKAWQLFREIEEQGGLLKALKKGDFQQQVLANAEKQVADLARRKRRAVGSNVYPNLEEKRPEKDTVPAQAKSLPVVEKFTALKPQRALWRFEALRKQVESAKNKPRIVFFQVGQKAQLKARSDFAKGFFEVAGLKVDDSRFFDFAAEAVEALGEAAADIAVLVATDDAYHEVVPVFAPACKEQSKARLFLAGNPGENEGAWREAGVHEFVHLRSNVLDTLESIVKK